MKKIFTIIFFLFIISAKGFASDDVVILETNRRFFYDNPAPVHEVLEIANNQNERLFDDESEDFMLDEDFADSKIEKVFTKFINSKIQNGRMNIIKAPINY